MAETIDFSEIQAFIETCTPSQLRTLEKLVAEQLKKVPAPTVELDDENARRLRAESRFDLELHGSLRRLTDIRPNQRTEYAVMIRDVSRNGMCVHITAGFVASRAVEVTFQGPNGKVKTVQLEVVRMKRIHQGERKWLELGCRSITKEELNEMLEEERQARAIIEKATRKEDITVFLISQRQLELRPLIAKIKREGYHVRPLNNLQLLQKELREKLTQLAILIEGSATARDAQDMETLQDISSDIAILGFVENEADRCALLKAGVDECVLNDQVETLLFRAMERALVGHTMRQSSTQSPHSSRALIISSNRITLNMLNYHLSEAGLRCDKASSYTDIKDHDLQDYTLILADFSPQDSEPFKVLRSQFTNKALVAICEKITYGTEAMACQASDYISLPLNQEQIQIMVQTLVPHCVTAL